jgi:hypothetical protein
LQLRLGWKDTFVRAAKTAVQVFVTGLIAVQVTDVNVELVEALGFTAGVAGVSIVLNKVLSWSTTR